MVYNLTMTTKPDNELLGQTETMSDDELDAYVIDLGLRVMDLILEKKAEQGKIVFSEVENGLLN